MAEHVGIKETAVIGGAPKPGGLGQPSAFLFGSHLEVSSRQGSSNQRMNSNHWGSSFRMLTTGPHPRGSYSLRMVQEPGICRSEVDVGGLFCRYPVGQTWRNNTRLGTEGQGMSVLFSSVWVRVYTQHHIYG